MAQGNPRDPKLERRWRRHFQRQQASGLTIRAYCLEHDWHESAFYFWRREIAARDRVIGSATASTTSSIRCLLSAICRAPSSVIATASYPLTQHVRLELHQRSKGHTANGNNEVGKNG
jgi:hypothetical protein